MLLAVTIAAMVYPLAAVQAQAPSWPTTWNPIGSCSENEGAGDVTPAVLDLVGAPGFPAAFLQIDSNFLYLRERVFQDPSGPGGFASQNWVVLLQVTSGNPFKYQWLISLDGNVEQVNLWQNDPATAANVSFSPIFNDPAETLVFSDSATTLARIVVADSNIGGAQNYFVDFAMPRSALTARGIDPDTSLYWFATSANSNNFNKDTLSCPFSPTTTLGLTKSVMPSSIGVGAPSPVTYSVVVTNTGTYSASGVVVSDNDFPSWLVVTNVTTTSGTVTFTTSSFEARIPSLSIGGSATITVTAVATPPALQTFTNTVNAFATNAPSTSASTSLMVTLPTATPTVTATPTITRTPTRTPTPTITGTPTRTRTPTATFTPSLTPTRTPTSTGTPPATPTVTATFTSTPVGCGNGSPDPGEECDDGNPFSGDGCEPDCTLSPACNYAPPPGIELFVNDNTSDGTPAGCAAPGFTTVQAAVNAAQDGDVISVCPGIYTEPVQLTKALTLRSTDGPAVTRLDTSGVTISVERSGTHVEGFTLVSDTTAVEANSICPPGGACGTPGQEGSNVTITGNVIRDSVIGVTWNAKIDCAAVTNNQFANNDRHVVLVQTVLTGTPALQVEVSGNAADVGGQAGAAVEVFGMLATLEANRVSDAAGTAIRVGGAAVLVAAGIVERAGADGIVVDDAPTGTQIIENEIRNNIGDGITIGVNAAPTRVLNNNITGNGVGLGNEASTGVVDATLNWWDSQTGPSAVFSGTGDSIVNRSTATTAFIEFLCKPFPQGFPSIEGVCSTEIPELRLLFVGSSPDIDPVGRFVAFESRANIDVDPRTTGNNSDGSQEVFLLNRKTQRSLGGVCLGGLTPGAPCEINIDCGGDPLADPLVLNGDCIMLTQVTDHPSPSSVVSRPRVSSIGKAVAFHSNVDLLGLNADGSSEVFRWDRKRFDKAQPGPLAAITSSAADSQRGATSLSSRRVIAESAADLAGQNADGNTELFLYDVKQATWSALTQSTAPADNRRPSVGSSGKQIVFDSTGDLDNVEDTPFGNTDGNREVFLAKLTGRGLVIRQLTNTQQPVENRAGGGVGKIGKLVVFSSNGNITGGNLDGNREVFVWYKGDTTQMTQSIDQGCLAQCAGNAACEIECGNVNPAVDRFGRFISFESTEDLEGDGSTNRRVFLLARETGQLLRMSRSRFGDNRATRISNGRFVVWESTADLTGGNPEGDRVIYMFDRRKDE